MNCSKCTTPLKPTDTFCSNCGAPVGPAQASPPPNITPPPTNPAQNPTVPAQAPVPGTVDPTPPAPPASGLNQQAPVPAVPTPQQPVPTVQGNQNNLANAGEVKNPILAAVLNYFVPFIGGYIYLSRWKKGLVVWGVYLGGSIVLNVVASIIVDIIAESEKINFDLGFSLGILLVIPWVIGIMIYSVVDAYKLAKKTQKT